MRCCWVANLWKQAVNYVTKPLPVENHGWEFDNDKLCVKWDISENIQAVTQKVKQLTKGCGCKSGCKSKRCGCCTAHQSCGVSFHCTLCENPHNPTGTCLFCPLKDSEGATVRDLTPILNDSDDDLGNDDYGIGEDDHEQPGKNDTNETSCATDFEDCLDYSDPEYGLAPESIDVYDI